MKQNLFYILQALINKNFIISMTPIISGKHLKWAFWIYLHWISALVFASNAALECEVENRIKVAALNLVEAAPMGCVDQFQQLFERNLRAEFPYDSHER